MKKILLALLLVLTLGACEAENTTPEKTELLFNFSDGDQGFTDHIADIPVDYEEKNYDRESIVGVNTDYSEDLELYWLMVNNDCDDVFFYLSKEIEGLKPNNKYAAIIEVTLYTPYEKDTTGISGGPASNVYVKAGVIKNRPSHKVSNNMYRLFDIDKGNQDTGGTDLKILGDTADNQETVDNTPVELYKVSYMTSIQFETNSKGQAYIMIGYDSGFEGHNVLGFESIKLTY